MLKRYSPIPERIEESFQKAPTDMRELFCDKFVKLTKNQISRKIEAAIVHKFDRLKLKDVMNSEYEEF